MNIRKATKEDLPEILNLIKELAEYERASLEVTNTLEDMLEDGFGKNPVFKVVLAEENNKIAGMALWFISYSTWKGRCLYLEDIIVKNEYRGAGIGKLLFDEVVKEAKKIKAKRLSWQVLEWNEPAINFYKKLNANLDSEWVNCKLTEKQIQEY